MSDRPTAEESYFRILKFYKDDNPSGAKAYMSLLTSDEFIDIGEYCMKRCVLFDLSESSDE